MAEIPQLYTCAGGGQRLMVDGRPYTLFAGECHNSASGGRRAFADALDRARALGMNTVLAPVTWELLEPAEGEFDFGQVDMMLELARERGLHLCARVGQTRYRAFSPCADGARAEQGSLCRVP